MASATNGNAQISGDFRPSQNQTAIQVHPILFRFISDGDFDVVPDDAYFRTYIVSAYKGIVQWCDPQTNDIGFTAKRYGSPALRELMDNPSWSTLLITLGTTGSEYSSVGIQDGIAQVKTIGCNTERGQRLSQRMRELMAARQDSPSEASNQAKYLRLLSPEWANIKGIHATTLYKNNPAMAASWERSMLQQEKAEAEAREREQARAAAAAALSRDQGRWATARQSNSYEAYRRYVSDLPSGRSVGEARRLMDSIETAELRRVTSTNTLDGYNTFIARFPGTRGSNTARNALNVLDQEAFVAATRNPSATAYREYLRVLPQGRYSTLANEWLNVSNASATTRVQVNDAQQRVAAATGKWLGSTTLSLASIAGASGLGYIAYKSGKKYDSLNTELTALDANTPEYTRTKSESNAALRNAATYGVGAGVVLLVSSKAWNVGKANRKVAKAADEERKTAQTRLNAQQLRLKEIVATRVSVVPWLNGRASKGLQLTVHF